MRRPHEITKYFLISELAGSNPSANTNLVAKELKMQYKTFFGNNVSIQTVGYGNCTHKIFHKLDMKIDYEQDLLFSTFKANDSQTLHMRILLSDLLEKLFGASTGMLSHHVGSSSHRVNCLSL